MRRMWQWVLFGMAVGAVVGPAAGQGDDPAGHWICRGIADDGYTPIRMEVGLASDGDLQIEIQQGDNAFSGTGHWSQRANTLHFRAQGQSCVRDRCWADAPSNMNFRFERHDDGTLSLAELSCRMPSAPGKKKKSNFLDQLSKAVQQFEKASRASSGEPSQEERTPSTGGGYDNTNRYDDEKRDLAGAHAREQAAIDEQARAETERRRQANIVRIQILEVQKTIKVNQDAQKVNRNPAYDAMYSRNIRNFQEKLTELQIRLRHLEGG